MAAVPIPFSQINLLPEIQRQIWLHQIKVRPEHGEFLSGEVQRGCSQEGIRGMSVGMQSVGERGRCRTC